MRIRKQYHRAGSYFIGNTEVRVLGRNESTLTIVPAPVRWVVDPLTKTTLPHYLGKQREVAEVLVFDRPGVKLKTKVTQKVSRKLELSLGQERAVA